MHSQKASTLILALWVLSFLTIFAVGLGYNVSAQLRLASHFQDRVKTYVLAYAGIQRAIMQLAFDETPKYDSFNEKWLHDEDTFKEMPLGEGYATVGYQVRGLAEESAESQVETLYGLMDENSRININRASIDTLKILLENAGQVEPDEATDIANAIIDWRDKDVIVSPGGAEDTYYAGLKHPYPCKDDNFEAAEELLLVKGMTPQIFSRIRYVITIFGNGKININTAESNLFEALGLSPELAQRIVDYRRGSDQIEGTEDDVIFESVGSIREIGSLFTKESEALNKITSLNVLSVESNVFRIKSTGILKKGNRQAKRSIVCVVKRKQKESPEILYWHEE